MSPDFLGQDQALSTTLASASDVLAISWLHSGPYW
jgi:hypothetical protein